MYQTAATMTMNSPESLLVLHGLASKPNDKAHSIQIAELMREAALKCISFNGVSVDPVHRRASLIYEIGI